MKIKILFILEIALFFNSFIYELSGQEVITWTRIRKPWYAPNFFVKSKMNDSIPEYKAISGLVWKSYSIEKESGKFGGIYLWDSETSAITWFNQAWFERIKDKYGEETKVPVLQVIWSPEFNEFTEKKIKSTEAKVYSIPYKDSSSINWKKKLEDWKRLKGFKTALIARQENEKIYIFSFWEMEVPEDIMYESMNPQTTTLEGNCYLPYHISKEGKQ